MLGCRRCGSPTSATTMPCGPSSASMRCPSRPSPRGCTAPPCTCGRCATGSVTPTGRTTQRRCSSIRVTARLYIASKAYDGLTQIYVAPVHPSVDHINALTALGTVRWKARPGSTIFRPARPARDHVWGVRAPWPVLRAAHLHRCLPVSSRRLRAGRGQGGVGLGAAAGDAAETAAGRGHLLQQGRQGRHHQQRGRRHCCRRGGPAEAPAATRDAPPTSLRRADSRLRVAMRHRPGCPAGPCAVALLFRRRRGGRARSSR